MSSLDSTKAILETALDEAIHSLKRVNDQMESCMAETQQLKTQLGDHQREIDKLKEANRNLQAAVMTCLSQCGQRHLPMTCLSQCGQRHLPMSCANCGSNKHNMVGCLKVTDGLLAGCILCNSLDHNTDECVVFVNMPLKDQVELIVFQRGSLPALKTKESWAEWFRKWYRHHNATNLTTAPIKFPGQFPWTVAFTVGLGSRNHGHHCEELQKVYDQHKDTGRLPRDPAYGDCLAHDFNVWAALTSGHDY